VNFAEAGVKVIGFDKSEAKVNKINSGENYIKDIRDAVLREVVDRVKLEATTDFSKMKECDALIICVPTPLDKFRKPDMSYIEASCIAIGQNMKPGTFISLESTTYPTTTEDFMLPLIEESSKQNPYTKHLSRNLSPLQRGTSEAEGVNLYLLNTAPTSGSPTLPNVLIPVTKPSIPKTRQKYSAQ
jgi:nucleotide sugar dehydrogenase